MFQAATFGAGCFWGTERYFKKQFGAAIIDPLVGYMGGAKIDPSYKEVCTGATGHVEVFQFKYDPNVTSYAALVKYMLRMHDPTTVNRQQGDVGTQYRSVVFFHTDEQRQIAQGIIDEINDTTSAAHQKLVAKFGPNSRVVTAVEPAGTFWTAEEYHQRYLEVNPTGYCTHRMYWDF
jgi:peptide-methionine (S)-S-oxide reductase